MPDAQEADASISVRALEIFGDAISSNFLMKFLRKLSGASVERLENSEITVVADASVTGGIATECWTSRSIINNQSNL